MSGNVGPLSSDPLPGGNEIPEVNLLSQQPSNMELKIPSVKDEAKKLLAKVNNSELIAITGVITSALAVIAEYALIMGAMMVGVTLATASVALVATGIGLAVLVVVGLAIALGGLARAKYQEYQAKPEVYDEYKKIKEAAEKQRAASNNESATLNAAGDGLQVAAVVVTIFSIANIFS